ncbi:MAG: hypothetical protein M1824_000351 [Vezdaea acicularis]|nr:MAG: hypothetical protein M1824_000351 [Vezdaea acicularis]
MSPIKSKLLMPFAFTSLPVTIITTLTYLALLIPIIVVHVTVPPAPSNPTPAKGINVTEAWADLEEITNGYHPYNSRRNDEVRDWLLQKIGWTLERNGIAWSTEGAESKVYNIYHNNSQLSEPESNGPEEIGSYGELRRRRRLSSLVTVFNDMQSNVTFSSNGILSTSGRSHEPGQSVFFEGTNIIVYIKGSEDDDVAWWAARKSLAPEAYPNGRGGILVNAHYDSVSSGFGATDDGIGVVTILQLIKYFTSAGQQPKKGIVLLLNNGEEDFLNGARAFTQHPISRFAHTFLNLEGAGAGGRATLFRSTDTEVTRYYGKSTHPFGACISGDGFKRGLVRSQTDYVVFNGELGLRGLDVAFMEPRQRYHTTEDDVKHTSKDSLWHMLSASLTTVKGLSSDTSSTFDGTETDRIKHDEKVAAGHGSDGVWFDLFGQGFIIFELHTFFAWSLTLLIASPLILIGVAVILINRNKMYLFSRKAYTPDSDEEYVSIRGWRGLFRFPLAFILASAAVVALAFLLRKTNPFIIYSSPWAVWSMMLSIWFGISWFVLRGANAVRPSALHRTYVFLWIYLIFWIFLVIDTVFEDRLHIAGGYFLVFYFAAADLALTVSFLEFFLLPPKGEHIKVGEDHHTPQSSRSGSAQPPEPVAVNGTDGTQEDTEEQATESTPLFRGRRRTFANYRSSGEGTVEEDSSLSDRKTAGVYGDEQLWSASLPKWTWLIQFLLIAPFPLILVSQIGLLFISAISQTGADGSSLLLPYLVTSIFSVLILLPLTPFLHRFTYHIPFFLFLVFTGTLIYNLIAFPFSDNNRLKVYFAQTVNLETGTNNVSLTGMQPYVREIVDSIPSSAGQTIDCSEDLRGKAGLQKCIWHGIAPNVVPAYPSGVPPERGYTHWLDFNATRTKGKNEATIQLVGRNTRACKIMFNDPIADFRVEGAADTTDMYTPVPVEGSREIRLWRREWEKPWNVWVRWSIGNEAEVGEEGRDGTVVCLWSDVNEKGLIPAWDEAHRFVPVWVGVTKLTDGLVEGSKTFML